MSTFTRQRRRLTPKGCQPRRIPASTVRQPREAARDGRTQSPVRGGKPDRLRVSVVDLGVRRAADRGVGSIAKDLQSSPASRHEGAVGSGTQDVREPI